MADEPPRSRAAREAAELASALHGERHPITVNAMLLQVSIGHFLGDADETLRQATRVRDLLLAVHGSDRPHARVLDGRFMYGRALGNVGRYAEARGELEVVQAQVGQLLGPEAPMAAFVAGDLVRFALELGDEAAALAHAQRSLAIVRRDARDDSQTVAMARLNLGRVLLALHRSQAALAEFEQGRQVVTAMRGPDAPLSLDAAALQAAALAQLGRLDEARALVEAPEAWQPALEAELSRLAVFLGLDAGAFGWRLQPR